MNFLTLKFIKNRNVKLDVNLSYKSELYLWFMWTFKRELYFPLDIWCMYFFCLSILGIYLCFRKLVLAISSIFMTFTYWYNRIIICLNIKKERPFHLSVLASMSPLKSKPMAVLSIKISIVPAKHAVILKNSWCDQASWNFRFCLFFIWCYFDAVLYFSKS